VTYDKKRLGLTVPLNLHEKIADLARYQGKTINGLCVDMFWYYFDNREPLKQTREQEAAKCQY